MKHSYIFSSKMNSTSFDGNGFCTKDNTIDLTSPYWAVRWQYSRVDKILQGITTPIISTFGIIGNLIFIWMVYRVKNLRSSVNAYLTNLAICDILFLVCKNGWTLVNMLRLNVNRAYPVTSALGCATWVITTKIWYILSAELTTLVTIERYLAICHPIRHIQMKGSKRNVIILSCLWFSSLGMTLSIVPRFVKFKMFCLLWPETTEYQGMPKTFNACLSHEGFTVAGAYEGFLYITLFLLAATLNCILSVKIIQTLHRRSRNKDHAIGQRLRVRNQVTRTLVASGLVFFVCQLPYRFYSLDDLIDDFFDVDFLDTQVKVTVLIIGRFFLLVNSIINPYLYVLSCEHYRSALRIALRIKPIKRTTTSTHNRQREETNI